VDIDGIPAAGLSDNTHALLTALQKASDPKRLVAGLSIADGERDSISAQYSALQVFRHSRLDRLWDVAIASGDTLSGSQLIRLNRVSPRWVFTSSGINGVRTWRKRAASPLIKSPAQDAIKHADGIIALRPGVRTELESYAGSTIGHLPAGGIVEVDRIDSDRIAQEIVERYGRSTIDIERLRARWHYFASYTAEPFIRRLIRQAENAGPRPLGFAMDAVRKLRGLLRARYHDEQQA
jgi:hypothetical protein